MADPERARLLELRARRLAVHGLEQRIHGRAGLTAAIADLDEADLADTFAAALGVIFSAVDPSTAAALADAIRRPIPALTAIIETHKEQP